jgi:hypothetical protein
MAQSTSLHNEMHMFTTYIEHVLLMGYLDRTISYVRDHIINLACERANGRVGMGRLSLFQYLGKGRVKDIARQKAVE